ncbi:hypothetical protein FRX31_030532, partial [Thalictrum thalictroides]
AAVSKLTFNVAKGDGSIWHQWIKNHLIKANYFWTMETPLDCSWIWRGILHAREFIRNFTRSLIADGTSLSFWHDPWTPLGILREKFSTQIRQRARIRDSAKVSNFINNGEWAIPQNVPEEMAEMWEHVKSIRPLQNHEPDKLIWMPHPRGKFTVKTAYVVLRIHHPKTPWTKLFWNGSCIPRQATIAWMAIQDALMTQDRFAASQVGQPMNIEQQHQLKVAWSPPPHGWTALNCDGALSQHGTGYAGILMTDSGQVLNAFVAGGKTNSVLYLEMIAVEKGLELATQMGLEKIMVQTDSMQVARILNELTAPTWRVESMVMHIKVLMDTFEEITIQHVFRESNKVADALATTYPATNVITYFCYPMENIVEKLLDSDANGTLYLRM